MKPIFSAQNTPPGIGGTASGSVDHESFFYRATPLSPADMVAQLFLLSRYLACRYTAQELPFQLETLQERQVPPVQF